MRLRRAWVIGFCLLLGVSAALVPPLAPVRQGRAALEGWTAAARLRVGRREHVLTLLADGRVMMTGGRRSAGVPVAVELFNPATGAWSATSSLATGRVGHSAT